MGLRLIWNDRKGPGKVAGDSNSWRVSPPFLPDKPVAVSVNCQDVSWLAGARLELPAQPSNVYIHGSRRRHRVVSPHLVKQSVPRKRDFPVFNQVAEQPELACSQSDAPARFRDFRAPKIHFNIPKTVHVHPIALFDHEPDRRVQALTFFLQGSYIVFTSS